MSLEQQIALLVSALEANTAAMGNVDPAVGAAAAAVQTIPAQSAAPVPATPAAAQTIPAAAAIPAAASPSNPAMAQGPMTLEQLQQEVTAIYQARNADPQVMATVQLYAPSLTAVPAEQYNNLITALRALP